MQPQKWCTALGVDTSYPILPCSCVNGKPVYQNEPSNNKSCRNTSEHIYTSAINAWSMYVCMHVYIYLHAMRALPLCVCLLEGVHTYVCDPEKAGEGNKFHMHIATDSKIFWQSFSIILSRGALLWRVWLHGAEGGKLSIVLFDETVECLLAVCRDRLENKLSENSPRCAKC